MRKTKVVASALVVLCLLAPDVALAQEVFIQLGEGGGGVLRARKSECFVITPYRIMEKAVGSVEVIGPYGLKVSGTPGPIYESKLSIIRLDKEGGLDCEAWEPIDNFGTMIERQRNGQLSIRNEDGGITLMAVTSPTVSADYIVIKPADSEKKFTPDMIGASLIVKGALVGMLLKINNDDEAVVYQRDDIMRITEAYFERDAPPAQTLSKLDLTTALSLLDRAIETKDGSMQGQVQALESLLARGYEYNDADLRFLSLRGANLSGGVFKGARLYGSDLRDTQMQGADFSYAVLSFTRLDEVQAPGVILYNVYAPFLWAGNANFEGANLSRANFFSADLRGANFRNADLRGAAFADLRGATFDGADLTGAYLPGAVLDSATFAGATIDNTEFTGAVADKFLLSPRQLQGVCRHTTQVSRGPMISGSLLDYSVMLTERWPSNRFSSGLEFDDIYDGRSDMRAAFRSFSGKSLTLCTADVEGPRGHDSRFLGHETLVFDREYLLIAGRREAFRKRIYDHVTILQEKLIMDRTLKGDGAQRKEWDAFMRKAIKKTKPISEPYLDTDVMLLILLQAGQIEVANVNWDLSAGGRFVIEKKYERTTEALLRSTRCGPPFSQPVQLRRNSRKIGSISTRHGRCRVSRRRLIGSLLSFRSMRRWKQATVR